MKKGISILHYINENYLKRALNDIRIAARGVQTPLINFLGIGVQKSGTSALDTYLRQHPEICLPTRKEIHYFDIEYNFRYPRVDYAKYHAFFEVMPNHRICGEVTPAYIYWDAAPRRIWEYNPGMKSIILLRNPLERAYSHWNMNRQKGYEDLSFKEALSQEAERKASALPYQNKRYSYLDRGFYSAQLRRIFDFFPRDQVLCLKSLDLSQHPIEIMNRVFDFIGVAPCDVTLQEPVHQGDYARSMTQEEKHFLLESYFHDIKSVERILGWDCSDWLEP